MSDITQRLNDLIVSSRMSYGDLAKLTGIPKSALQRYATGATEKIPINRLEKIAEVLNSSAASLLGWDEVETVPVPQGLIPLPGMRSVPLIGTIACGEPILAEENIEGEAFMPEQIHADFALRCKGDSMIDARIRDGDIVYIRQQPTVENGEIAAVLIDDEATLKRVYLSAGAIILQPANPRYEPMVIAGNALEEVRIIGKAVGFTSVNI